MNTTLLFLGSFFSNLSFFNSLLNLLQYCFCAVLVFPRGTWDLGSPRDQTHTPWLEDEVLTPGPPGKSFPRTFDYGIFYSLRSISRGYRSKEHTLGNRSERLPAKILIVMVTELWSLGWFSPFPVLLSSVSWKILQQTRVHSINQESNKDVWGS